MNIEQNGFQKEMNIENDASDAKQEYSSPVLLCHGRVGSKTQGSIGNCSDGGGSQSGRLGNCGAGGAGSPGH
jgi:hypothetical protein